MPDTAIIQRISAHSPIAGPVVDQPIIPRRLVQRRDNPGGFAFQQPVSQQGIFPFLECKRRQEKPVDETFHKGGQRSPPNRIHPNQVVCPLYFVPGFQQVRLEFRSFSVTELQVRVELQVGNHDFLEFGICCQNTFLIRIGKRVAIAFLVWVSVYNEYFLHFFVVVLGGAIDAAFHFFNACWASLIITLKAMSGCATWLTVPAMYMRAFGL